MNIRRDGWSLFASTYGRDRSVQEWYAQKTLLDTWASAGCHGGAVRRADPVRVLS